MKKSNKEQKENMCETPEEKGKKIEVIDLSSSSSAGAAVYEIPGEPAIVIDGMPVLPPSDDGSIALHYAVNDAESLGNTRFGMWLVGREVRKLFGDEYYTGTVTEFDEVTGWWRVVYEDGDLEDLEWNELEPLLHPLDIMVPLKSLALKTLKKSNKHVRKPKNAVARPEKQKSKRSGSKGKEVEDAPTTTLAAKQSAKKGK